MRRSASRFLSISLKPPGNQQDALAPPPRAVLHHRQAGFGRHRDDGQVHGGLQLGQGAGQREAATGFLHIAASAVHAMHILPPQLQQVPQYYVPGLAVVRSAHPDDGHPMGLEQGAQGVLGLQLQVHRRGRALPEGGVAVQGDELPVLVEHERVHLELAQHPAAGPRPKRGKMRGQAAQAHLGVHDPVNVGLAAFRQVLLVDVGGGQQGGGPFPVHRQQHQVGRGEMSGEMLRVLPPLAEGEHRAEGVALPEAQQGLVAQGG